MSRKAKHSEVVVQAAQTAAKTATSLQELRRAQSILLPVLFGATLPQTAEALGLSRATVCRLQATFLVKEPLPEGTAAKGTWGGRRRCWLTREEEKEFLAPWLEQAAQGRLVVISPLRAALAQRLGRSVRAPVVYRMLARHGWRKLAPDTKHPKSDPITQEAWKKNSRRNWRPY